MQPTHWNIRITCKDGFTVDVSTDALYKLGATILNATAVIEYGHGPIESIVIT